jgi:hypothetical protein
MERSNPYWQRLSTDLTATDLPEHWAELIGGDTTKTPTKQYNSFGTQLAYWELEKHLKFPNLPIQPDRLRVGRIRGQGLLLPHRDHGITSTLNLYLEASGDDTTEFWQEKPQAQGIRAPNSLQANIYSPVNLDQVDSFSADKGDCILLNSREIHSVRIRSNSERILLSLMWTELAYKDLANILK